MYSRSYKQGDDGISIPESYSGVAFREPEPEIIPEGAPKSLAKSADVKFTTSPEPPDPKLTAAEVAAEPESEPASSLFSSFTNKLPFKSIFTGLSGFDLSKFRLPKINTEEILIIGLALFLFLSKEGDKECAMLLLLLLLIQ